MSNGPLSGPLHPAPLGGYAYSGEISPTSPDPEADLPHDAEGMTPTDFVLWLNGALDVLDTTPPTQAQWDVMREKIAGQVGAIVANRIQAAGKTTYALETALDQVKQKKIAQAQWEQHAHQVRLQEELKAKLYYSTKAPF